jgi:hypothetical protein
MHVKSQLPPVQLVFAVAPPGHTLPQLPQFCAVATAAGHGSSVQPVWLGAEQSVRHVGVGPSHKS